MDSAPAAAGVTRAIQILRADLIRAMKLLGCASSAISRVVVTVPEAWTPALNVRPNRSPFSFVWSFSAGAPRDF
jgi:hypothetical protein